MQSSEFGCFLAIYVCSGNGGISVPALLHYSLKRLAESQSLMLNYWMHKTLTKYRFPILITNELLFCGEVYSLQSHAAVFFSLNNLSIIHL